MKEKFLIIRVWLGKLTFRTGVIMGLLCVLCYLISFAQMLLPFSLTVKGVLWVVFFGLAKTFQYSALLILGKEGISRIRSLFRNNSISNRPR